MKVLHSALQLARDHWLPLVGVNAAYFALTAGGGWLVTRGLKNQLAEGSITLDALELLAQILVPLIPTAALLSLYGALVQTRRLDFKSLWPGWRTVGSLLGVQILMQLLLLAPAFFSGFLLALHAAAGLAAFLAFLFFALWFYVRFGLAPLFVVRGHGTIGALTASMRVTRGRFWVVVARFVLIGVVAASGIILLGIGVLFTSAVAVIAYWLLIDDLQTVER